MVTKHVNLPDLPPQQENQRECMDAINYNVHIGNTVNNKHMTKTK